MSRFIEGEERSQSVLFPESLDEWITDDNPVRVVETGSSRAAGWSANRSATWS